MKFPFFFKISFWNLEDTFAFSEKKRKKPRQEPDDDMHSVRQPTARRHREPHSPGITELFFLPIFFVCVLFSFRYSFKIQPHSSLLASHTSYKGDYQYEIELIKSVKDSLAPECCASLSLFVTLLLTADLTR